MSGSTAGPADKCRHVLHQAKHRDIHLYRDYYPITVQQPLPERPDWLIYRCELPCDWLMSDKF